VIVRCERPGDEDAIAVVHGAAFDRGDGAVPPEVPLVNDLRTSADWIAALSFVAELDGAIAGHVVCSRAVVADDQPVLGLGPLGVAPPHQRQGVGLALMHAVLGAADALGEPLVALLGNPRYYERFGFVASTTLGITAPDASYGVAFQARPLTTWTASIRGAFRYAAAFDVVS
jgi:putative acetyltransferase